MSKNNKKSIIVFLIVFVLMVAVLLLLIPLQKKNELKEKWGSLAVLAETDERAKFIIENEELYPEEIIDMFYTNEKNLDFVYNYPLHKDDYQSMSFTEEELNCEGVPALYMDDLRWGYETIDGAYIKSTGCMAVSLTMANLYLNHNSNVDPIKVALVAEENDNVGIFGGINNDKLQTVIDQLGMASVVNDYTKDMEKVSTADIETIKSIIDSGHVCLAGMVGDTFGVHALIIREVTEDGKIRINDPASPERTEKIWDFEQLEPEIYYLWDLSAKS